MLTLSAAEAQQVVREIDKMTLLEEDWDTGEYSLPKVITNRQCEYLRDAVQMSLEPMRKTPTLSAADCKAMLQAAVTYLNAEAIGTVAEELAKAGFELED